MPLNLFHSSLATWLVTQGLFRMVEDHGSPLEGSFKPQEII